MKVILNVKVHLKTPNGNIVFLTNFDDTWRRPRSGSSCKSCLIRVYSVCLLKYDISDPTLVDLASNFFVLFTKVKVYLYKYSKWVEPSMNIHEGKG